MRTLFITYSYLGGHGGGVYASRTHINLFAELSERMTLLYPHKEGEEPKGINVSKMEMIPVVDTRSNRRKFVDLVFGKVHRFSLNNELLDINKYDVVVFDSSVVSSGLIKKVKKAGLKAITIHHNYQIEYLKGDCSSITLLPNLFWTYKYEKEAVKYSDLNLTLTKQDIELLKKHYDKDAYFAVLGVFEYQRNTVVDIPVRERGHKYVMTGGLGSKQTEDSIINWIKEYYPILLRIDALAQLSIAGSNPSERLIQEIKEADINLISSPPDMKPILQEADYYLNPVDCGGGLKLRNLDGLKYGMPVLTHKVSLRGYEKMEDCGVVFSYENTTEFTEGIRGLMAIQLGKKAIQKLYLQHYEYKKGIETLLRILNEACLL